MCIYLGRQKGEIENILFIFMSVSFTKNNEYIVALLRIKLQYNGVICDCQLEVTYWLQSTFALHPSCFPDKANLNQKWVGQKL